MRSLLIVFAVGLMSNLMIAQEANRDLELNNGLIEATLYHDNGAVAQTGYYTKDGKLQGEWVSYDINGKKTAEAYYYKGAKVGTWTFYHEDTMKKVSYTDSKIAKVETWEYVDSRVVSNKP